MDAPPRINLDERRMHVRAYNFWVSLLNGRQFPSIDDLDPTVLDDFGPHSLLLDFTHDPENPAVPFLGAALREESAVNGPIHSLSDIPARSVLSRLTDHYLQIIANRAPIGFEAEYVNQRNRATMYRGILMPFTSNGKAIDYIYGVINWKECAEPGVASDIIEAVSAAMSESPAPPPVAPLWDLSAGAEPADTLDDMLSDAIEPGADASLYDRLAAARILAEESEATEQRSRASLYRTLGLAYDFVLAAAQDPATYAEILEDAGLVAQARAPMTPVVKLIFGASYDKTRLAEYAAVLDHGRRVALGLGELADYLGKFQGGLKGVVKAERIARRPADVRPGRAEAARTRLAAAPTLATVHLGGRENAVDSDYISLIGRRLADGSVAILAVAAAEESQLIRATRQLES